MSPKPETDRRSDDRRRKLTSGTCALQNSHDRETCARSLRATQESRPSPGAFPPPAPCIGVQQPLPPQQPQQREQQLASQQRCRTMNQTVAGNVGVGRPHRPASLDIGMTRRYPLVGCTRTPATVAAAATPASSSGIATPSSAPAACTSRGFFDDGCTGSSNGNGSNPPPGFELNVNVACSPAGNRGTEGGRCLLLPALILYSHRFNADDELRSSDLELISD